MTGSFYFTALLYRKGGSKKQGKKWKMQKRYNIEVIFREEYLKNRQDIFQVIIDGTIAAI
jgi:hypothetical protein